MPAKTNTNTAAAMNTAGVKPREINFVTAFDTNWDELREVLGYTRPIRKTPGTILTSVESKITLADSVGEGEEIAYSQQQFVPATKADLTVEKYAIATSIEAVAKYGAELAVEKSDEEFMNQLQSKVLGDFFTFVQTGTLTSTETSFQMAVAMAVGNVADKFKKLHKGIGDIIVFVNTLDAYRYLGAANITVQNKQGLQYVQDFLGAKTMVLTSSIPSGKVIATPQDNIDLYYVDPADSDFAQLGLDFTTAGGDTNLIGVHIEGNYKTAVGETTAILGMKLWAEYLDGIAVVTIAADASGD